MVVALGPGRFYGSSLPRPRFYTDVKFSDHRVDPPPSVTDPLMAWAEEAHWSMGGLNFKRHRLQGRIEGNIQRLRTQREHVFKKSHKPMTKPKPKQQKKKPAKAPSPVPQSDDDNESSEVCETPSPQPPPVAIKRRRVVVEEEEEPVTIKKGPVRKLGDDFERVARESGMENNSDDGESERSKEKSVIVDEGKSNNRRRLVKGGRRIGAAVVAAASKIRSSPRLARRSG